MQRCQVNSVVLLAAAALTYYACVALQPHPVAAEDECISCEWFSPLAARALFLVDAVIHQLPSYDSGTIKRFLDKESGGKNLHFYWHASAKKGEEKMLDQILQTMVDITEAECQDPGDWADVLTALEARLEEGEYPSKKNEPTPFGSLYQTRDLTRILEDQHLRLIDSCRVEAIQVAQKFSQVPALGAIRKTLADYGEYLENVLAERNSVLLAELSDDREESEFDHLSKGRKLITWDYLFDKVKSKAAAFFVQHDELELSCTESLEKNLIKKYEGQMAQVAKVLDPLSKLTNYKPDNFVQIPPEEQKGRKIFQVSRGHADFLERKKDVAVLIELYSFWKAILKRKTQLCG